MFLSLASARRSSVRGFASRMALALALASGAVVASSAFAPVAYAQSNSRGFAAAYQPVAALVTSETPDWAGAAARFETLVAAIQNEDDRNVAGNFALQIGTNTNNPAFQRRGLEMMLQSGKVAPAQIGQFNFFVASLAYQAEDFAAARAAMQAAIAAGWTQDDPHGLIVESFNNEENYAGALDYIDSAVAAGAAPVENWYLRVLQETYSSGNVDQSLRVTTMLVKAFPTSENWMKGLQVINELAELDEQAQLDLLRLMRATGAMSQRPEYARYIDFADPRIMSNEVLAVLAEGVAAGHFAAAASDEYYTEIKAIADARAPQDRRDLPTIVRDGETGAALDASVAGDVLYSLGDFARAEAMYQLAIQKGGDRNVALTRVGMMQVMQGKNAEAIATLRSVDGARQPVAHLWATWAEEKMGG